MSSLRRSAFQGATLDKAMGGQSYMVSGGPGVTSGVVGVAAGVVVETRGPQNVGGAGVTSGAVGAVGPGVTVDSVHCNYNCDYKKVLNNNN